MSENKIRKRMRYQRVYRGLRGRVLSGHYVPGQQIETETQLTEQFDVSVITIRQAVGMLEEEGFLDRQQGRGTFVPESVSNRFKILCVVGLDLDRGLSHNLGSYHSDLVILSKQETSRRGMEFETVWLGAGDDKRIEHYLSEDVLSEYWGFVFIATPASHPLLLRVQDLNRRCVVISSGGNRGGRSVWLDYPAAVNMALDAVSGADVHPPVIFAIEYQRQYVESALAERGEEARQEFLFSGVDEMGYDSQGYHRTLELINEGVDLSNLLVFDDVVAHGVTRALLKSGYSESDVKLVVICGKQEIISLGMPITYVIHDTAAEVQRAFDLLEMPPSENPESWCSGFSLMQSVD
jgi:hypothetical protein